MQCPSVRPRAAPAGAGGALEGARRGCVRGGGAGRGLEEERSGSAQSIGIGIGISLASALALVSALVLALASASALALVSASASALVSAQPASGYDQLCQNAASTACPFLRLAPRSPPGHLEATSAPCSPGPPSPSSSAGSAGSAGSGTAAALGLRAAVRTPAGRWSVRWGGFWGLPPLAPGSAVSPLWGAGSRFNRFVGLGGDTSRPRPDGGLGRAGTDAKEQTRAACVLPGTEPSSGAGTCCSPRAGRQGPGAAMLLQQPPHELWGN